MRYAKLCACFSVRACAHIKLLKLELPSVERCHCRTREVRAVRCCGVACVRVCDVGRDPDALSCLDATPRVIGKAGRIYALSIRIDRLVNVTGKI